MNNFSEGYVCGFVYPCGWSSGKLKIVGPHITPAANNNKTVHVSRYESDIHLMEELDLDRIGSLVFMKVIQKAERIACGKGRPQAPVSRMDRLRLGFLAVIAIIIIFPSAVRLPVELLNSSTSPESSTTGSGRISCPDRGADATWGGGGGFQRRAVGL